MFKNLEALRSSYSEDSNIEFLFFWGHTSNKSDLLGSECLSQWYPCQFSDDEYTYSSTEQYMMAGKAKLFCDNGECPYITKNDII